MSPNSAAATLVWGSVLAVDEDAEVVLEGNWSHVLVFQGHSSIGRNSPKKLSHHDAP